MAGQTKRAAELKELAELVAQTINGVHPDYKPTLTDPAMADAYDAAMASIGHPARAWRGSKSEARS